MEEKLRSQLEEEKTRYKTMFMRLKALKVEIEHLQLLMDKAKVKLQKEFDAWWAEEATSLQVNSPPVNLFNHVKPFPQTPESQHKRSQLLSNQSDVYTRKILPSPGPLLHSQEQSSTGTRLEDSIAKRPVSSVPLTGDSQTDSDILAFIKARQSILQRTGDVPGAGGPYLLPLVPVRNVPLFICADGCLLSDSIGPPLCLPSLPPEDKHNYLRTVSRPTEDTRAKEIASPA
ncbi:hypothetical protein CB1_001402009 [Camelus ferus]|nr:hypothetical protein CB1_001402009 [Camelus ferus]